VGPWEVTVTLDEAGDHSFLGGGTGIIFIDDHNTYSISVEMSYRLG